MPRLSYIAQDRYKNTTRGELEARDRDDALKLLAKRGLTPLKLEPVSETGASGARRLLQASLSFGGRLTAFDRITLIRHLGTILQTGTDILSGLEMIAQDTIRPRVRKILYDLRDKVSYGETFSEALKRWRGDFGIIFISLVKAGEAAGNLPSILLSYAQELRKDYTFSRRLKGAMVYPAILILTLLAMLILVLTVVTPRLKEIFKSTNADPPIYTKAFFWASDLWLAHSSSLIILGVALILGLAAAWQNNRLRERIVAALWYFPILKKLGRTFELMRFAKTLSSLLDAGFSLKAAMLTASDVVSAKYKPIITDIVQKKLEKGIGLADAMREHPNFFPGILVSVVKTGEKSGQLSRVLSQMGEFYEEEVLYSLELFLTLIEPILLLVVGIIVGLMTASLIAPIYRLIGKIR